jgi:hypothetical protein
MVGDGEEGVGGGRSVGVEDGAGDAAEGAGAEA